MATKTRKSDSEPKAGSLDELWELVDGIEVAMLTTRRADGHMVSRPMATQKRASGADFWFSTLASMPKVKEIAAEPRVNLSYYKDRTKEWVSIAGVATHLARPGEDPRALGAGLEALVSGRGRQEGRERGGSADRPDRRPRRVGGVHDRGKAAGPRALRHREEQAHGQDSGDGESETDSHGQAPAGAGEGEAAAPLNRGPGGARILLWPPRSESSSSF